MVSLASCNQSGVADVAGGTSDSDAPAVPGSSTVATGLDITKISVFQGIESILVEDGAAPERTQVPIVAGRDALLRVHVAPHDGWEERKIDAVVTFDNGGETDVVFDTKEISEASDQASLNSTINVDIPGDLFGADTVMTVELFENDGVGRDAGEGVTTWTSDEVGGLAIENTDQLDVVIIPVKYMADGSGRLPDTSEEQLTAIRDLMYGMYPATEVTVTVGEELEWNRTITAFTGWDELLVAVNDLRGAAQGLPPNTYYYAMFRPVDSFNQFCQAGCILGLSYIGMPNDPWYRASMGVGYPGDTSVETVPHELGHAHGREHAPCGLYGQPADPGFPYNDASLGSWGYDLVSGTLLAPKENKDMMSYCAPMWLSDFTYYNLYVRIQEVGRQNRSATTSWRMIPVTSRGELLDGPTAQLSGPSGEPHEVTLLDGGGQDLGQATGYFVPYDHLPGGVLMVPEADGLYTVDAPDLVAQILGG